MDAWCKYLGTAAVGPDDNFFDCGGDSLMLARLHAALQAVLRVQFPITAMFEFTTVRSLAGYLDGRVGEAPLSDARQRAQRQRDAFARRRERRIGGV